MVHDPGGSLRKKQLSKLDSCFSRLEYYGFSLKLNQINAKGQRKNYLTYIQNLQKENRIRYAEMFEVSYSSFIKFNKYLDIPFSDIDIAWLKRYEKWTKEQNFSISAISTRIKHLRAVFNLAITEYSIKNDCYPFHS